MKQYLKIASIIVCVILFTACGKNIIGDTNSTQNPHNNSQTQQNSAIETPQYKQLVTAQQENIDTAAWIYIPGTSIDNSIMQTANNEDYLRKNEKGESDIWGCYFADYYSNLTARESLQQNTVVYGHSENTEIPDGKRFTQLFKYLDIDFLQQNPNIYVTLGNGEQLNFEIFAVFFTDVDFYYIDPNPTDQGFEEFVNTINEKNQYRMKKSSLTAEDKLLTLSTCAYRYDTQNTGNHRLVVMAKLLPENAGTSNLSVSKNPNPQVPQA